MVTVIEKARRPRGRPHRTSREQMVAATLDMLEEHGLPNFTMAKLAAKLGISVMALYTYFPSRDALLDAVAESVFASFEPPLDAETWRERIRSWQDSLYKVFEQRPIAFKLIKWDEHLSPAWMSMMLPVVRILRAAGLSDEKLAFATSWTVTATMGILTTSFGRTREAALAALEDVPANAAELAALSYYARETRADFSRKRYEMGVHCVVAGLADLVEG